MELLTSFFKNSRKSFVGDMKRATALCTVLLIGLWGISLLETGNAEARIVSNGDSDDEDLPEITENPQGTRIGEWQYKVDEHHYYIKGEGDDWYLAEPSHPSGDSSTDSDSSGSPPPIVSSPPTDLSGSNGTGEDSDGSFSPDTYESSSNLEPTCTSSSLPMFNDFERWVWYNRQWWPDTTNGGGMTGPMSPSGVSDPQPTRQSGHDGRYCLRLSYDFPSDKWCGFFMYGNDGEPDSGADKTLDVSNYTDISLWVKKAPYTDAPEPPAPDPMKVELEDKQGNKHGVYVYMCSGFSHDSLPEGWTRAVIPLDTFSGVNLSELRLVNLVFDVPGEEGETYGAADIDTVKFLNRSDSYKYPSGLVVDVFNDGAAPNELGGNAGVAKPSGSSASIEETYVKDSYEGLGALKLTYDRKNDWVGYWSEVNKNVSNYNSLRFFLKGVGGGEKFKVELNDSYNNKGTVPISEISGFSNGAPSSWEEVAIPLEAFEQDGVNLSSLQEIDIVFDTSPDSGSILIDQIKFSKNTAPPLVNEKPNGWISEIDPQIADEGESITFKGSGNDPDGEIVKYEWESSIDGVFKTGSSLPVEFTYSSLSPGEHTIYFRVKDDRGDWSEKDSKSLTIESQNQTPVADFDYSPTSPTVNDVIQFTDQSSDSDGTIESWSWDFDDGSTSSLENPSHQYTEEGTYNVSLTVTDDDGATDNTETALQVTPTNGYPNWDVNRDGKINVGDLTLIGQHWGETGSDHWIRADVNGNGEIGVGDMTVIGQNWTG